MSSKEDMIYDLVKEAREDQKKTLACMTGVKVEQEKINAKLHVMQTKQDRLEGDIGALKTDFDNHEDDDEVHYNAGIANESLSQKIVRKKGEIAVASAGGAGLFALILGIIELVKVMMSNGV